VKVPVFSSLCKKELYFYYYTFIYSISPTVPCQFVRLGSSRLKIFCSLIMSLKLHGEFHDEEVGQLDISATLSNLLLSNNDAKRAFRDQSNILKLKGREGVTAAVKASSGSFVAAGWSAKAVLVEQVLLVMSSEGRPYWQKSLTDGSLSAMLSADKKAYRKTQLLPSRVQITNLLADKTLDDPMRLYYEGSSFNEKFGEILDDDAKLEKYNKNLRERIHTKYRTIEKTYEQLINSEETWSCINRMSEVIDETTKKRLIADGSDEARVSERNKRIKTVN
jgi:hypothetical protein